MIRTLLLIVMGFFIGVTRLLNAAPPPLSDGFTPQRIHVPDGFTVELAAGPPLVWHPMFATFDDRGRLFVCENAGLNMSARELEEKLPNSIRMLEDTDHDGRFDQSTLFADKMTFPMGGAWHNGALYVASPPNVWRLEDIDGDGVADRRDVLVGKFGDTGNAASIHGCIAGPDGRLYWSDGYHGHEFKDHEGRVISKREGSYLFSCLPVDPAQSGQSISSLAQADVRIHCGGGMDNPVEVDFTIEGEMLGTVNIMYTRPRIDCLVHWLHGGAYPHREQVLNELKVTGDLLGPVLRFGHVAPSGIMRYRSGILDLRWRDCFFAAFFNSGKVVRLELQRQGATFRAAQREFLSCASRDFHPTDVIEDADGSLLIIDTGGWFYRGCPTSQFAKPDLLGAIYRVRRAEPSSQVDPGGRRIDWAMQRDLQLMHLLGDARFTVRERAIVECTKRGQSMVTVLRLALQSHEISRRIGALWALTRIVGDSTVAGRFPPPAGDPAKSATIGADRAVNKVARVNSDRPESAAPITHAALSDIRDAIRLALDDPDPSVRLTACRSIATYPEPAALDQLLDLLRRDEPQVRREAATALGRLREPKAVSALLTALARADSVRETKPGAVATNNAASEMRPDKDATYPSASPGRTIDRAEDHAIVYALIEINNVVATRAGLVGASANTRRGALMALDQMDGGDLTAREVVPLLADDDVELQRAAGEVFSRRAEWRPRAAEAITLLLKDRASIERNAAVIRKLTTRALADDSVGELVGKWLNDANTPNATCELFLAAIADGQGVPLHKSWIAPLERLLAEARSMNRETAASDRSRLPSRLLSRALAAITAIKTARFRSALIQLGSDKSLPVLVRAAALEAASDERGKLPDDSLDLLLGLLDGGPRESLDAAQMIGGKRLSKPQLIRLAPRLASAGPSQLQELLRPFQRTQDADVAKLFLDAMENARSLSGLSPPQVSDTIKHLPRELLPAANRVLDRIRKDEEHKLARLDSLLPLLEHGNVERGRKLFFAEKSRCATCHRVAEQGGRIGPDLTTIGANRAARDLLESIVFPSATIVRGYEPYMVATTDGRVLSGLIIRETSDTLFIQQQTGDPVAIAREEVEEISASTNSIMPNGLEKTLTEAELADMIAYLTRLEQQPPEQAFQGDDAPDTNSGR